jgi:putative ABC transport system permease protein
MLFHHAVMSRILVDNMVFLTRIRPVSYVLAVLITNLFAYMVNLLMRKRIRAIPMAESLKAVE